MALRPQAESGATVLSLLALCLSFRRVHDEPLQLFAQLDQLRLEGEKSIARDVEISFSAKGLHQFSRRSRLLGRKIADSTLQLVRRFRQSFRIPESKRILDLGQVSRIICEKETG
jgi:hypothetical protein